jgi:hypothetical protein
MKRFVSLVAVLALAVVAGQAKATNYGHCHAQVFAVQQVVLPVFVTPVVAVQAVQVQAVVTPVVVSQAVVTPVFVQQNYGYGYAQQNYGHGHQFHAQKVVVQKQVVQKVVVQKQVVQKVVVQKQVQKQRGGYFGRLFGR